MNDFFEAHHAHKQTYTERPVYHDTYHYHEHDSRDELFDYYYHRKPEQCEHLIKTQANWTCNDPESPEFIKNKPNLAIINSISLEDIRRWDELCEKYPEQVRQITELLLKAHTHNNKEVLDKLTLSVIDNSHKHDNKNLLDSLKLDKIELLNQITQSKIDSWNDVVQKSCNVDHKNQNVLDQLTQLIIEDSHNHKNKELLDSIKEENVHSHTNKDVLDSIRLQEFLHWEEAYDKTHTHENKCALDQIECASVKLWDKASKYFTLEGDTLRTEYKLDIPSTIEVVDNLESTDADRALSANLGRILKEMIDTFEWEEL